MIPAGYSSTPLGKKLGLKPGSKLRAINAPENFSGWLEDAPLLADRGEIADVVVLFLTERDKLLDAVESQTPLLAERGGLWIAWPKKASKVPTDITEDVLRDVILPLGLVDNKVCAISDVWSGLRFVRRLRK